MPELEMLGIPFAESPYPMWIFDRETLAFLEVNCAATRAYGFSRAEFLAMTLLDIRPAEDIPELIRETQHPQQSTAESWRHKGKDGVVFSVVITSWELTYKGHPAELVLARREEMVLPQALPVADFDPMRDGN
jgi:two-component system, cell cycle sensor histidine kinase and response regulator CckA